MDCPICSYKGIPESAAKCPKCNSDITAFRQIYALRDSLKQKRNIIIALVIVIIAMMAYVSYVFLFSDGLSGRYARMEIQQKNSKIINLSRENAQLKTTLLDMQQKYGVSNSNSKFRKVIPSTSKINKTIAKPTNDISKSQQPKQQQKVKYYRVQAGETLYSIAKKFYNEGSKYKKIMKDNNITDPSEVKVGYKLKIILND